MYSDNLVPGSPPVLVAASDRRSGGGLGTRLVLQCFPCWCMFTDGSEESLQLMLITQQRSKFTRSTVN